MSEQRDNFGCLISLAIFLMLVMFIFSMRIGGLRSEVRDLQRRVGQLESER